MVRISIIGCGNMGSSIASALAENKDYKVTVYDSVESRCAIRGADAAKSLAEARDAADVVLIAIKPQYITKEFLSSLRKDGAGYISIAAGVPLAPLQENLGTKDIARFMPNMAAKAKKAVTAVAFPAGAGDRFQKIAMDIAGSFGSAFQLDESQFSAFIGISGSLIAYALEFVNSSAMAGVRVGIPYQMASQIVKDTLVSACSLLELTGKSPADLIPSICSASGTTIAAMEALEENGFTNSLYKAVEAASQRSEELEENAKERLG